MHKNLRKLLHVAEGHSEHVVVIFLDVRGFSTFAKIAESSDAAEFLTTTYTTILDRFFSDAEFVKLTGDGMLVLYAFDRQSLTEVVRRSVDLSLKLLDAFPTITTGDPMINFDVPTKLGLGLARGAATKISSGRTVLDYSGRPLNAAARLMDLARPEGVVLDAGFGFELLTASVKRRFERELVYLRSIAEGEPRHVYYLPDRTKIPDEAKRPLNVTLFTEKTQDRTLGALREMGEFLHPLTHEPADADDIVVHLEFPTVNPDGGQGSFQWSPTYKAKYAKREGRHWANVEYSPIVAAIEANKVTDADWPVKLTIEYSTRSAPSGG